VFVERKLGGGAFGVVFEAINRNTKERVACKMIQKIDDSNSYLKLEYNDNQLYMINSLKR
jgi:serine/threonine protein kinase